MSDPFPSSRTHNRIRSPRFEASGRRANVDKGSRHHGSVTLGQRLALRVGLGSLSPDACGCRGCAQTAFLWVSADLRHAGVDGGGDPLRRTIGSELVRARGIRLFNQNKAL
eukprot:TRINITY_DN38_c0_g1_i1.p8 TRINITY_DN38_c0_g1~~TRINITY_DN38_c0_g1_i1.p8  ORF type:complete len:111 (-),score=9.94 TRINITY_DN38_c0_g1_i1:1555-1887(-)